MTPIEFKTAREQRGTQDEVAFALGVYRVSVARWETGAREIGRTTELALLSLPIKPDRKQRKSSLASRFAVVRDMEEQGKIRAVNPDATKNPSNDLQGKRTGQPSAPLMKALKALLPDDYHSDEYSQQAPDYDE